MPPAWYVSVCTQLRDRDNVQRNWFLPFLPDATGPIPGVDVPSESAGAETASTTSPSVSSTTLPLPVPSSPPSSPQQSPLNRSTTTGDHDHDQSDTSSSSSASSRSGSFVHHTHRRHHHPTSPRAIAPLGPTVELIHARAEAASTAAALARAEREVAVLAHSVSLAQAELSSVRTALSESERKAAKATKELALLEERWIAKVQADAEQLNEANVFYQQMNREKKNLALLRQAQEEEFTLLESKSTLSLPTVAATKAASRGESSPDAFARAAASALGLQQDGTPTSMVRAIAAGGGETTSVAFDPSGSLIATGGADATVQVWDGLSGARRATLRGASKSIMSIELSPSGERLVASSNDHAARIWTRPVSSDDILSEMLESTTGARRATTGSRDEWSLAQTLTGHMQKVFASTFSADGLRVVTGSHDRTIKIWDATKGTCFRTIFCFSSCNTAVMSMDGGMVTSGHLDNSVRMWSTRSGESLGEMLRDHRGQVTSLTQNPMNESLLLSSSRDNQLRMLDVRMQSVVQTMGDSSLRTSVNWARASLSPDGVTAALGGADGIVYCFDVRTCKVVQRLRAPSSSGTGTAGAIAATAWNPRGCQLAVVDRTGTLRVWS